MSCSVAAWLLFGMMMLFSVVWCVYVHVCSLVSLVYFGVCRLCFFCFVFFCCFLSCFSCIVRRKYCTLLLSVVIVFSNRSVWLCVLRRLVRVPPHIRVFSDGSEHRRWQHLGLRQLEPVHQNVPLVHLESVRCCRVWNVSRESLVVVVVGFLDFGRRPSFLVGAFDCEGRVG